MTYGFSYQGNKSKIAKDILGALPSGERLVDLFGGGFAITHCAMLNFGDKYNSFLYNDICPLNKELIKKAIDGVYSYDKFTPEFITREQFSVKKESDGYVKWLWSFGGNGVNYMYSKDIEPYKHELHNYVVFGEKPKMIYCLDLKGETIRERRLELRKTYKLQRLDRLDRLKKLEHLERLECLQQLQQLQQLECLERLELHNFDYRNYIHKSGDVVYCDIPYECKKTKQYGVEFNHKDFYGWAKAQPFDIYVSGYIDTIPPGSQVVWRKEIKSTFSSTSNRTNRIECLFKI